VQRVLLIWNPASSEVTGETVGSVLVQIAEQVEVVAMHTQAKGDAARLAKLAVEQGYDAVFVLGGDGTSNEVVNGIGDQLPIGVLPAGGTSVLPRALGLPRKLDEAVARLCSALEEGSVRTINLGILDERRFTFAAGIGIDAEIVKKIDERGRGGGGADESKRPGDIWFLREAIGLLTSGEYASPSLRVEVPGQGELTAATVFAANCSPYSYAGPLPLDVAPDASFEGGFDLVVVESVEARSAASKLASLLRREDAADDGVHRLHDLEHATVICESPTAVQVDGELLGEFERVELGLVRGGARLLV
jgi:diacylglycerol kinase family enzyme